MSQFGRAVLLALTSMQIGLGIAQFIYLVKGIR